MGAEVFVVHARGNDADEAFFEAVRRARYDYGHAGYTGTIAEKNSYVRISTPKGMDPYEFASELIHDGDPRIDDKWGPAGCVECGKGQFLFFGWASC